MPNKNQTSRKGLTEKEIQKTPFTALQKRLKKVKLDKFNGVPVFEKLRQKDKGVPRSCFLCFNEFSNYNYHFNQWAAGYVFNYHCEEKSPERDCSVAPFTTDKSDVITDHRFHCHGLSASNTSTLYSHLKCPVSDCDAVIDGSDINAGHNLLEHLYQIHSDTVYGNTAFLRELHNKSINYEKRFSCLFQNCKIQQKSGFKITSQVTMHCLDEEFKNIVTIICQYCRVLKRPDAMIYHATMTAYRTHCSNEMENDEVPLASRKVPKNTGKSQAAGDKTEGKYKSWYQVYLKDKRDGVPEEDCRVPKKHPHPDGAPDWTFRCEIVVTRKACTNCLKVTRNDGKENYCRDCTNGSALKESNEICGVEIKFFPNMVCHFRHKHDTHPDETRRLLRPLGQENNIDMAALIRKYEKSDNGASTTGEESTSTPSKPLNKKKLLSPPKLAVTENTEASVRSEGVGEDSKNKRDTEQASNSEKARSTKRKVVTEIDDVTVKRMKMSVDQPSDLHGESSEFQAGNPRQKVDKEKAVVVKREKMEVDQPSALYNESSKVQAEKKNTSVHLQKQTKVKSTLAAVQEPVSIDEPGVPRTVRKSQTSQHGKCPSGDNRASEAKQWMEARQKEILLSKSFRESTISLTNSISRKVLQVTLDIIKYLCQGTVAEGVIVEPSEEANFTDYEIRNLERVVPFVTLPEPSDLVIDVDFVINSMNLRLQELYDQNRDSLPIIEKFELLMRQKEVLQNEEKVVLARISRSQCVEATKAAFYNLCAFKSEAINRSVGEDINSGLKRVCVADYPPLNNLIKVKDLTYLQAYGNMLCMSARQMNADREVRCTGLGVGASDLKAQMDIAALMKTLEDLEDEENENTIIQGMEDPRNFADLMNLIKETMKAFDSNSMAKRLYKKHEDELRTANADLRYGFKDHQVHKGSHREVAWQETSLLPVVEARDQYINGLIDPLKLCTLVQSFNRRDVIPYKVIRSLEKDIGKSTRKEEGLFLNKSHDREELLIVDTNGTLQSSSHHLCTMSQAKRLFPQKSIQVIYYGASAEQKHAFADLCRLALNHNIPENAAKSPIMDVRRYTLELPIYKLRGETVDIERNVEDFLSDAIKAAIEKDSSLSREEARQGENYARKLVLLAIRYATLLWQVERCEQLCKTTMRPYPEAAIINLDQELDATVETSAMKLIRFYIMVMDYCSISEYCQPITNDDFKFCFENDLNFVAAKIFLSVSDDANTFEDPLDEFKFVINVIVPLARHFRKRFQLHESKTITMSASELHCNFEMLNLCSISITHHVRALIG